MYYQRPSSLPVRRLTERRCDRGWRPAPDIDAPSGLRRDRYPRKLSSVVWWANQTTPSLSFPCTVQRNPSAFWQSTELALLEPPETAQPSIAIRAQDDSYRTGTSRVKLPFSNGTEEAAAAERCNTRAPRSQSRPVFCPRPPPPHPSPGSICMTRTLLAIASYWSCAWGWAGLCPCPQPFCLLSAEVGWRRSYERGWPRTSSSVVLCYAHRGRPLIPAASLGGSACVTHSHSPVLLRPHQLLPLTASRPSCPFSSESFHSDSAFDPFR
ncbi:hypothetical protein C8R47DRAFT_514999 [Mycena vitilis]|nr:hypothetical protein C8R47DRAFT_514999 [Mycena vitilis]